MRRSMRVGEARDFVSATYWLFTPSASTPRPQSAIAVCRSHAFTSDCYGTPFQRGCLNSCVPNEKPTFSISPRLWVRPVPTLAFCTNPIRYICIYMLSTSNESSLHCPASRPAPWCLVFSRQGSSPPLPVLFTSTFIGDDDPKPSILPFGRLYV